jgi:hypothetical protein
VITKTIVQSNKDLLASSQVQNQQSLVAVEKWVQNIPEILEPWKNLLSENF